MSTLKYIADCVSTSKYTKHITFGGQIGHSNRLREIGGAPRNPAPMNHLLVWIVKPSGCDCTDVLGGNKSVKCRPLLGALPLSLNLYNDNNANNNITIIIIDNINTNNQ